MYYDSLILYLSKNKIKVKPTVITHLISNEHTYKSLMVQEKAKKYLIPIDKCIHCKRKKEKAQLYGNMNPRYQLCKKHASIYDYTRSNNSIPYIILNESIYYLFGEYACTPMVHDENGFFVIWLGSYTANIFAVFSINKRYFPNIKTYAYDITDEISKL